MAVFTDLTATALELIAENGHSVTWRKVGATVPDPAKPWLPAAGVDVDTPATICFLSLDRDSRELSRALSATAGGGREVADGVDGGGELVGYMGQVAFVPAVADVIVRFGDVLRIVAIDKIQPNDEGVILYVLLLRH